MCSWAEGVVLPCWGDVCVRAKSVEVGLGYLLLSRCLLWVGLKGVLDFTYKLVLICFSSLYCCT